MQSKVKECRGCGTFFKSWGHSFCGRCRYAKTPGHRAESRVCPVCGGTKSATADYCARCYDREMSLARSRLKEQAESRLTQRLVRESRDTAHRLYGRPPPRQKPKADTVKAWVNPHGFVIGPDGYARLP